VKKMTEQEMQAEIDRLTGQLAREKEHKSAADRNVSKHLARVKELEALIDPDGDPNDPLPDPKPKADNSLPEVTNKTDEVAARELAVARRERVMIYCEKTGADFAETMSILVGADEDRIDNFQNATDAARQAATDAVLKAGGRVPGGGISLNYSPPSMETLENLALNGTDVVKQFGKDAVHAAAQAAEAKPTLRQRLADRIGGSK
jgi:hypothetical protein